jgi:hypothetical protein
VIVGGVLMRYVSIVEVDGGEIKTEILTIWDQQ